jgi:2-oxoglutarate dehydrogenase E1 component
MPIGLPNTPCASRQILEQEFEAGQTYKANDADWFGGRWAGLNKPADPETARRNVPTGISRKLMDGLGRTLTTVPEGHTIHKTLGRVLDAKREHVRQWREFRLGDG